MDFLNEFNIQDSNQFEFIPNHNTSDALMGIHFSYRPQELKISGKQTVSM